MKNETQPPIVVFSNQTDMEKQRRISRTEANQFLNDLGKPVFRISAANNYDSVREAFDETSRWSTSGNFQWSKVGRDVVREVLWILYVMSLIVA